MSEQIKISMDPDAEAMSRGFERLPVQVLQAVASAMDLTNQLTVGNIQARHLTGKGPFSPEQNKLGVVTNRLRGSVNASPAVIQGDKVNSAIGSNVAYAAIHEFGGVIQRAAHAGKVRLRTDKQGNLIRQPGHPQLAMFARASHKRAKEVAYQADAYEINMPERMPFRAGIYEMGPTYTKNISVALVAAMKAWS